MTTENTKEKIWEDWQRRKPHKDPSTKKQLNENVEFYVKEALRDKVPEPIEDDLPF